MANRISKVYTRTGDSGTTGLGDGNRVDKDHPRIIALGSLDELNCQLGLLLCEPLPEHLGQWLTRIQHQLFNAGGELSIPNTQFINSANVDQLEHWLDELNDELTPLKEFILPGGTRAAAICHLARSVCRRCEINLTTLASTESVNKETLKFINRLSDLLFITARFINRSNQHSDVYWDKDLANTPTN